MTIKTIDDENFNHYKKPSIVIGFPNCTFKCETDCGEQVCQNGTLATSPNIEIEYEDIVTRYMNNNLTSAIVMAGLEPFDDFDELYGLIGEFRKYTKDDIVIFTGYNRDEINENLNKIHISFSHVIVKFGRYIPNQEKHFDDVLGVYLASDNQYAEVIS